MNVAILSPSGPNTSASPERPCPSDPVRGADGVQHAPALDQLDAALPLQLDQAAASALDAVAHVAPGVLAQPDRVGRGPGGDAGGRIHGVAQEVVEELAPAHAPRHPLPTGTATRR